MPVPNSTENDRLGRFPLGMLAGAILIAQCALNSPVQAAGCHWAMEESQTVYEGGQAGRLTEWNWWTTGPVMRSYHGGRFYYFQVPGRSTPCEGPSCRGSLPESSLHVAATIEPLRLNWDFKKSSTSEYLLPWSERFEDLSGAQRPNPVQPVPLRPPIEGGNRDAC